MGAERTSGGRVTEAWGTLSVEPSVLISSISSLLFASVPGCICACVGRGGVTSRVSASLMTYLPGEY